MELTFQYFWLFRVFMLVLGIFLGYRIYKSKFKSKLWWTFVLIFIVLYLVSPIKLKPDSVLSSQNYLIESSKVLPEKVEDKRFSTKSEGMKGIQHEDLK